jgi:hypothetical protein
MVSLQSPTGAEATEAANDLGIFVSKVVPQADTPAPAWPSRPIEVVLSKRQLKDLRRVSASDVGLGVLYGLILWTLLCVVIFVASVALLGHSVAQSVAP